MSLTCPCGISGSRSGTWHLWHDGYVEPRQSRCRRHQRHPARLFLHQDAQIRPQKGPRPDPKGPRGRRYAVRTHTISFIYSNKWVLMWFLCALTITGITFFWNIPLSFHFLFINLHPQTENSRCKGSEVAYIWIGVYYAWSDSSNFANLNQLSRIARVDADVGW